MHRPTNRVELRRLIGSAYKGALTTLPSTSRTVSMRISRPMRSSTSCAHSLIFLAER